MRPCISQVTTLSTSFADDLKAYSRSGFELIEIWFTKLEMFLEDHTLEDVRALLTEHGLQAVAAAGQAGIVTISEGSRGEAAWVLLSRRLGLLEELDIPTLVVALDIMVPFDESLLVRLASNAARATEMAEQHGIRLAWEFQKTSTFGSTLETAATLLNQFRLDQAHSGLCLDVFHFTCGASQLQDLQLIDAENLAHVQISDTLGILRELARDRDRILPGDGDLPLGPILQRLQAIGYSGPISLEVGNPQLWEVAPERVADLGYQAVVRCLSDHFRPDPGTEGHPQ